MSLQYNTNGRLMQYEWAAQKHWLRERDSAQRHKPRTRHPKYFLILRFYRTALSSHTAHTTPHGGDNGKKENVTII